MAGLTVIVLHNAILSEAKNLYDHPRDPSWCKTPLRVTQIFNQVENNPQPDIDKIYYKYLDYSNRGDYTTPN